MRLILIYESIHLHFWEVFVLFVVTKIELQGQISVALNCHPDGDSLWQRSTIMWRISRHSMHKLNLHSDYRTSIRFCLETRIRSANKSFNLFHIKWIPRHRTFRNNEKEGEKRKESESFAHANHYQNPLVATPRANVDKFYAAIRWNVRSLIIDSQPNDGEEEISWAVIFDLKRVLSCASKKNEKSFMRKVLTPQRD